MSVRLKWKCDELFLGMTKMAYIVPAAHVEPRAVGFHYVLGPADRISKTYQLKGKAREACEATVREMLKKAGADA